VVEVGSGARRRASVPDRPRCEIPSSAACFQCLDRSRQAREQVVHLQVPHGPLDTVEVVGVVGGLRPTARPKRRSVTYAALRVRRCPLTTPWCRAPAVFGRPIASGACRTSPTCTVACADRKAMPAARSAEDAQVQGDNIAPLARQALCLLSSTRYCRLRYCHDYQESFCC
jgi:hypothetical protein